MTLPDPPDLRPGAQVDTVDLHRLPLWRVWHPGRHTLTADALRPVGPIFRFDPHPVDSDDHDVAVWYGAQDLPVALLEVYNRLAGPRIDICPSVRASHLLAIDHPRVVDLSSDVPPGGLPTASVELGTASGRDVYATTQTWARSLHRVRGVHGIRYRAARSQHTRTSHAAVVLWNQRKLGRPRRDILLHDPAVWPIVVATLRGAGLAPVKAATCPRC